MAELILVANRLPVERGKDGWRRSPGGVVSVLESVAAQRPTTWIGLGPEDTPRRHGESTLHPVALEEMVASAHRSFTDDALWPLFHGAFVEPRFDPSAFDAHLEANRRVAEEVLRVVAGADPIDGTAAEPFVWVHDLQLLLVPGLLRSAQPTLRVGFFLHTPFPPAEVFARLPWRSELLEGVLAADVIGFQTQDDLHNFRSACRRLLGPVEDTAITEKLLDETQFVVAPVGADVHRMGAMAQRSEVAGRASRIREEFGSPERLLLGVDRLDYTKGIHAKVRAVASAMRSGRLDPSTTALVQVATPTREHGEEYRRSRVAFESLIAECADLPIHWVDHSLGPEELVAHYLAADVMVVTPLCDGMNLVSKEYIAARDDDAGALVLSEFAGSARQLAGAWMINPFDEQGLSEALIEAVGASVSDRAHRMRMLRSVVGQQDSEWWARRFLGPSISSLMTAPSLLVCVDFDGTIAPIVEDPARARALPGAISALDSLAARADTSVAILSGRDLSTLRRLLGVGGWEMESVMLIGSYGAEWSVPNESHARWTGDGDCSDAEFDARQQELLALAEGCADGIDGVHLERKRFGIAVHVRRCHPRERTEVIDRVASAAQHLEYVTVRHGSCVVELTLCENDKVESFLRLHEGCRREAALYIGDDIADESVFTGMRGLNEAGGVGLSIKVGAGATAAHLRVGSPIEVVALLQQLAER